MTNAPRSLLVSLLAAGLFAPVTITTATAASGGCTSWLSNSGMTGNVKCTDGGGTSQHRAVVTCINGGGTKWTITGPWRYRGRTSSATCSTSGTAGVAAIDHERRNRG
ncbi:hypothetical protein GCM10011579_095350 [Streptomyces albiflavescens]|uniref:Secreted protein n=1 Tax=Streptomyces albiflavescens TaxID=1623582 RepID=A0A917YFS6_9ACTN|nr:hypothetical protein [Streptomyces albiflavescens]GGN95135.1 hypothetical protein GCM10011579_095350 [Streptomyces albiflavescens]